jgi:NADH dehydrogenase FAD-containing subunit
LQHEKFRNIFSLGDCAALPISKTAAAAAAQSGVVTENILRQIQADMKSKQAPGAVELKEDELASYNGYTSCPLVTGKGKVKILVD